MLWYLVLEGDLKKEAEIIIGEDQNLLRDLNLEEEMEVVGFVAKKDIEKLLVIQEGAKSVKIK